MRPTTRLMGRRVAMPADGDAEMPLQFGRILALLQATPLPTDLIDNPARTGQWLVSVGNLHQAQGMLRSRDPALGRSETRGERVVRHFNRMIHGLPLACLDGMSPISKLALLWPLLRDLEGWCLRHAPKLALDRAPLEAVLRQYHAALELMAARHAAPDPPLRMAGSVPAGE
jgi:hypothetical protein